MDIKHKRARDKWSHVRMFWGWGGVGRDRIQVDRLMGWAEPNGNGLDSA